MLSLRLLQLPVVQHNQVSRVVLQALCICRDLHPVVAPFDVVVALLVDDNAVVREVSPDAVHVVDLLFLQVCVVLACVLVQVDAVLSRASCFQ